MTTSEAPKRLDQYTALVGAELVARIREKARPLEGTNLVHLNGKSSRGAIPEILCSLTSLMDEIGMSTDWQVIRGTREFTRPSGSWENAPLRSEIRLSIAERNLYEQAARLDVFRPSTRHDFVIVHDFQLLPLIHHQRKRCPWVWHCHADLSNPNTTLFRHLRPTIERYDALILTLEAYRQAVRTPQIFFPPAIDPFSATNCELSDRDTQAQLEMYDIPDDLPILLQVGRPTRSKNPEGAIHVFELVHRAIPCTLVLVGTFAEDDPENQELYDFLVARQDERIRVIWTHDPHLVNALQRRATVVLQMSLWEDFGLAVAEALWKGKAVVARRVGGLRLQVHDGKTGFLVDSDEAAAERTIALLSDEQLRRSLGEAAHRSVKERFLMTRLLERYVDLLASFESRFVLRCA